MQKPSVAQALAVLVSMDGYWKAIQCSVSGASDISRGGTAGSTISMEEVTMRALCSVPQEWQHEVKSDTKAQYQILKKLMHDDRVDAVVCATDAGREGELIFRLTYNMAGCRKPMKRLWISSMEESAIRDGFHNLRPGSDYDNLYHSALCRQEADWLVGINGTRLFTVLYGGKALKVGRVQTLTLAKAE